VVDATERVLLCGTQCELGMAQRSCDFGGHDEVAWTRNLDGARDDVDKRPEVVASPRVNGPVADRPTRGWQVGVGIGH
jgi:hypothetical protein